MGCHTICINQTMNIMGRITTAMSVFMGIRPNFKNNFKSGILDHRKGFLAVSGQKSASIWAMAMVMFLISAMGMAQTQDLYAVEDAYLQRDSFASTAETLYNDETLRLENSNNRVRDAYLKFDLNSVPGQITGLLLTLTVHSDPGVDGAINVYKGNGDNWTDELLSSATKPSQGTLIDSFSPPYPTSGTNGGNKKTITIDPSMVSASKLLSLVLVHTGPHNDDMAFAADGPEDPTNSVSRAPLSKRPKLRVTYTTAPTDTPPVIDSFTGTAISDTQIDLSWSATDDNGVTGYTLTMNGATQTLSSATAMSFSATGLSADTIYDFQLTATDGTNSTVSAVVPVTTLSAGNTGGGGYWTQTGSDISYTAGHVGIGTAPRSLQMLAVAGEIIATRVRVEEQPNWPDYVFNEDYRLPSLEEVQEHIEAYGHLINIPSAADVAANGMDLGEMNRLLLEKVEELTLYLLQQDQELKALQTQISNLEKE